MRFVFGYGIVHRMGNGIRSFVVAVVALAVGAPAASGATLRAPAAMPRSTVSIEQAIAGYLPIARAHWPESPCTGREVFEIRPSLMDVDGVDALGRANPEECRIRIRAGISGAPLCNTVVHEAGHLAGFGHVKDRRSVMHATRGGVPECQRAPASVEPFGADMVAAWWLTYGMKRGTRARCAAAPSPPTAVRCAVRDRWGKLNRWSVFVTGAMIGDIDIDRLVALSSPSRR